MFVAKTKLNVKSFVTRGLVAVLILTTGSVVRNSALSILSFLQPKIILMIELGF